MSFSFQRFWAWPSELRRLGVLGMNRRNGDFILPLNSREYYPDVDDKLRTKALCAANGIQTPATYDVLHGLMDRSRLPKLLDQHLQVVLKPARGSGGRGIIVISSRVGDKFMTPSEKCYALADLRHHCAEILAGLYSLGGQPDSVIIEQRIECHPAFNSFAVGGTPDIRVIVYRGEPVMAMARLPTKASNGRANLHQGAVAVAIELESGTACDGVHKGRIVERHPDTQEFLSELTVPGWSDVLNASQNLVKQLQLGFVGVDIVIDRNLGAVILEANARPGLAIQIANRSGLLLAQGCIDSHRTRP